MPEPLLLFLKAFSVTFGILAGVQVYFEVDEVFRKWRRKK